MIVKFKAYITLLDKIVDVEKIDFRKQVLSFNDERRFHQLEWFLDDCVLLQFTGVEDTFHKREVYNGDIYRQWYYPDHKDYTVEFEGGGFFLGDDLLIDVNWSKYEYIGNRFKN